MVSFINRIALLKSVPNTIEKEQFGNCEYQAILPNQYPQSVGQDICGEDYVD